MAYVVDVFKDWDHAEHRFDTEETASPGIYDVVELIEEQVV